MIFLDNKYTKIYYQLMNKRKTQILLKEDIICETHHIIPKSLGGSNEKENLVNLTLREHFMAHLLLTKMVDDEQSIVKMNWALHKMCFSGKFYFGSRDYEWYRKRHIKFLTENHHSKRIDGWNQKMSDIVFESWKNNEERRKKTSSMFKKLWENGTIKPKEQNGEKNHMWGKKSWNNGKKYKNEKVQGSKNPSAITVTLQNENGDIFCYPSLKDACNELNLDYKCMLQVSRGKNKQHKGYKIISKIKTSTLNRKEVPK